MIDFGEEADFGWSHGIVVWEEKLELEDAAYVLSAKFKGYALRDKRTLVW